MELNNITSRWRSVKQKSPPSNVYADVCLYLHEQYMGKCTDDLETSFVSKCRSQSLARLQKIELERIARVQWTTNQSANMLLTVNLRVIIVIQMLTNRPIYNVYSTQSWNKTRSENGRSCGSWLPRRAQEVNATYTCTIELEIDLCTGCFTECRPDVSCKNIESHGKNNDAVLLTAVGSISWGI